MNLSEKDRALLAEHASPMALKSLDAGEGTFFGPATIAAILQAARAEGIAMAEAPLEPELIPAKAPKPRPKGWYWITRISGDQEGMYQVAQWEENRWWTIYDQDGSDGAPGHPDSDVEVHSDRLPYPGEVNWGDILADFKRATSEPVAAAQDGKL